MLMTMSSVHWCRNHVLMEDVEYFLEKTKAKECFDMLDLDKDGRVSLQVQHCSSASLLLLCIVSALVSIASVSCPNSELLLPGARGVGCFLLGGRVGVWKAHSAHSHHVCVWVCVCVCMCVCVEHNTSPLLLATGYEGRCGGHL